MFEIASALLSLKEAPNLPTSSDLQENLESNDYLFLLILALEDAIVEDPSLICSNEELYNNIFNISR